MPGNFRGIDTAGTAEVELDSVLSPSTSASSVSESEGEDIQHKTEKVILEEPFIQIKFNHSLGFVVGYDNSCT